MRFAPWVLAVFVAFAAWRLYTGRDIERAPGVLAAADPVQHEIGSAPMIDHGTFRLRPRAQFSATVRILSRENYSLGDLADLMPTDFAVGWGRMSDSAVLADIEISQANRFYFWRTENWALPREEIETHSANWHVIPESRAVKAVLDTLRPGSVVQLNGRLVDIEGREDSMSTSLTRNDTGLGACEILLASSARVVEPR